MLNKEEAMLFKRSHETRGPDLNVMNCNYHEDYHRKYQLCQRGPTPLSCLPPGAAHITA